MLYCRIYTAQVVSCFAALIYNNAKQIVFILSTFVGKNLPVQLSKSNYKICCLIPEFTMLVPGLQTYDFKCIMTKTVTTLINVLDTFSNMSSNTGVTYVIQFSTIHIPTLVPTTIKHFA